MKKQLLGLLVLSLTSFAQEGGLPDDAEPVELERVRSVEVFEQNLGDTGDWVQIDGVRAFRPSVQLVGGDFVPYASHGHWVSTEAGWSFSSTLPFGWATFHYGRWWLDPTWGWVWVPDTVWGPSWVDWRFGGGYAGWAPLPPSHFVGLHRPRWFFVEAPYFGSDALFRHAVPRARIEVVFSTSAPVPTRTWHGATWYAGPAWRDVVHVAVAPPQRRSMREFGPPPGFHAATPVNRAPTSMYVAPPPPPPGQRAPPPPRAAPQRSTPGLVPPSSRPPPSPGFGQLIPPPAPARQNPGFVPPIRQQPPSNTPPPPVRQNPGFVQPLPSRGTFVPPVAPQRVQPQRGGSFAPPAPPTGSAPPPPPQRKNGPSIAPPPGRGPRR